jgi:hypothetical protein
MTGPVSSFRVMAISNPTSSCVIRISGPSYMGGTGGLDGSATRSGVQIPGIDDVETKVP